MNEIRVYVPTTLRRLGTVLAENGIGPAPLSGRAVTSDLRRHLGEGPEEDLEYAALSAAAQDSIALLTSDEPPLRAVLAVDVATVTPVQGEAGPGLVEVAEKIPATRIAAVHIDSEDARAAVARARDLWEQAEGGDTSALLLVERCLDHELGWHATQEIRDLVGR